MENKYFFKRSSRAMKLVYAMFLTTIIGLIVLWLFLRTLNNELSLVSSIVLPILIVFGILGLILQIFVINRFYYVKLTEEKITICRGFPKTFKYSDIHKISFSGNMLKSLTLKNNLPFYIFLDLDFPTVFIKDISNKYKKQTKKKLFITEKL